MVNRLITLLLVIVAAGCAPIAVRKLDARYGPEAPRDRAAASSGAITFERDIAPIFNRRCLVCHACYDAPCQLKMENFSGLDRGASPAQVYDAARLREAPLTRLGIDAHSTQAWRDKDFHPVLNERNPSATNDLDASVLYRMLALKSHNPLPTGILPEKLFDFSLSRSQSCSTLGKMPKYEKDHPQWGMPFGLPPLTSAEMESVTAWLSAGAKTQGPPPISQAYAPEIAAWEAFFNGDSPKERLMSRYIFEHLFLATIFFDELGSDEHFRLVRSRTPPGQPIDVIATRRPYDDPGVARPYYRLQRNLDTLVSKTNMAYALNAKRMQRWKALFLEPDYQVGALPDYTPENASNPFVTYRVLPVRSRYQFMLDEAQYTIMGFIKGPVCRGQIALNVIEDHFWVWFIDPDVEVATNDGEFLATQLTNLELPASEGSNNLRLWHWRHFAKIEKKYMAAKAAHQSAALSERPQADAGHDLGRRWRQSERRADDLPPFRQRDRGEGTGRRRAQDRVGDRLSPARAHSLPAGRRLRRLRQRRPAALHALVHGLSAHRRRVQLRVLPAARGA